GGDRARDKGIAAARGRGLAEGLARADEARPRPRRVSRPRLRHAGRHQGDVDPRPRTQADAGAGALGTSDRSGRGRAGGRRVGSRPGPGRTVVTFEPRAVVWFVVASVGLLAGLATAQPALVAVGTAFLAPLLYGLAGRPSRLPEAAVRVSADRVIEGGRI